MKPHRNCSLGGAGATPAANPPGTSPEGTGSRREFLLDCARLPLAVALAATGAWLALREPVPGSVEPCIKQRVCRGCQLFAGCEKPQAVATRKDS